MRTFLTGLALGILVLSPLFAQPPSGGDRASRGGGGDAGGRGFPGGGGGFPGGGGGFGGGRGGPGGFPGGGFPGGGPGGIGRGGPGGGFPGGGAPGGMRGTRGGDTGGGGGFNPADMLKRFDRNGNNLIDPDEAEGPAQFFLQRLAQNNPRIDLKKPVPIDLLTSEMERMRGGGGSSERDSGPSASDEPELLVPDFRSISEPMPLEGFGAGSSIFNVKVEERDLKEAEDRMKRYDQNKDGVLSTEELKAGRWSDDPLQYDRNGDGKLNKAEMAVRYANRRVEEQNRRTASSSNRGGQRDSRGWSRSGADGKNEAPAEVDRFGDAKSYRLSAGGAKVDGLPDFFARSDADGDGQVLMSEFSSSWSQETLDEFLKWDLNKDGIIIASECLAALANGVRVGDATAASTAASSSGSSAVVSSGSSGSSGSASAIGGSQLDWAKRQIGKYDSNGDGQLTANEWEKMIIKPTGADLSGDGVITAEEYAEFRAKK